MVYSSILTKNPCFRCGKERIVLRTYKKKDENGSVITYTEMVCPDPECQKLLDMQLAAEKKKRLAMTEQREKDAQARMTERNRNKQA